MQPKTKPRLRPPLLRQPPLLLPPQRRQQHLPPPQLLPPPTTPILSAARFWPATPADAAKGKIAFLACQTCHAIQPGVNKIGPSLAGIIGRASGSIPGYTYSAANKAAGITWTPEKLFQYLEAPQRIVPGTKMTYPGLPDPQKRADVIAYLKAPA